MRHQLGEGARAAGSRAARACDALRGRAGDARLAPAAPDEREPGDPLTDPQRLLDLGPELDDLPANSWPRTSPGDVERIGEVQVRAAHPARGDPHEHLTRTRDRVGRGR